jgi:hypothetical protein
LSHHQATDLCLCQRQHLGNLTPSNLQESKCSQ